MLDRRQTVAIVGVGLIGGSIGKALRARGLAGRVVGIGRDAGRLDEAREVGAIDEGTTDPVRGLAEADVAVICTPVDRVAEDVRLAARVGPEGMLITDAGSTKRAIVEAAEADPSARCRFVGAHPIAGSERNGVAHSRDDLFEGRVCLLTPTDRTPADRLDRCRAFWRSLGCRLFEMPPGPHDRALALTSHLPHVVASALAATVPEDVLPLAAGGYRDSTRIAGADSALWSAIFLANRGPLLDAITAFEEHLAALRIAVGRGDEAAVRELWDEARRRRRSLDLPTDHPTSPPEPRPAMIPSLAYTYARTLDYARRLVADVPPGRMACAPAAGMNHPSWVLGHLTWAGGFTAALLGVPPVVPDGWEDLFSNAGRPVADVAAYPDKAVLLSALEATHAATAPALLAATDEQFAAVLPMEDFRRVFPTVGDAIVYLVAAHEGIHLGQLSAWRRVLGLPPVWDRLPPPMA